MYKQYQIRILFLRKYQFVFAIHKSKFNQKKLKKILNTANITVAGSEFGYLYSLKQAQHS